MRYNPDLHRRRSLRLGGYDYAQAGAYFVTICVQGRECLFGQVVDGEMQLNEYGEIVAACWHDLPQHYPTAELDAFAIMPNHVHGIIVLADAIGVGSAQADRAGFKPAPTKRPLSEIVRAFKTFSARPINEARGTPGVPVWQRNYYEHIIRNELSLQRICDYIANNPLRWTADQLHPDSPSKW